MRLSVRWALSLGALLVVLLIGLTALLLVPPRPSATRLVLAYSAKNAQVEGVLRTELGRFHSLYPSIEPTLVPASEPGDVAILGSAPSDSQAWKFPLTPWSGSLWVLAARSDLLDLLAKNDPGLVADLRKGLLEPSAFPRLLALAKSAGSAPIALGNSHYWPLLVWVQAWTASTLGPERALSPGSEPDPAREVANWKSLGYFDATMWGQGWAQGLRPLQEGAAVFALLSEPQLSALSPSGRASLEFLPFPRRLSDRPWSLGTAEFLAVSATTAHAREGELLVRYLTSPGVTSRLTAETGRPFFAWNLAQQVAPVVLPDWSTRIGDPEVLSWARSLAQEN